MWSLHKSPSQAQQVVEKVRSAFPDPDVRPSPEEVEAVMRPFGMISAKTWENIDALLGGNLIGLSIDPWIEANFVVSGTGDEAEKRIKFLMQDTCTCVLDHLPKAIEHSILGVDPRILALLDHPHLQKKKNT